MGFLHGYEMHLLHYLIMQCWKSELTETINRNANYSFFELVRQKMRLKFAAMTLKEICSFL